MSCNGYGRKRSYTFTCRPSVYIKLTLQTGFGDHSTFYPVGTGAKAVGV
jgi:hypothetical protein